MQGIQAGIRFQIQKQVPFLKGIKLLDVGTVGGHWFFQRIGDGIRTAKGRQGSVDPEYHRQAQGNTCSQYKPVLPDGRIIEKSAQCPGTAGPYETGEKKQQTEPQFVKMEASAFIQNDAVNGEIPVHPVKGQKDSVQIPIADEWFAGKTMPTGRVKVQKARLFVVILAGIIRQEA